MAASMKMAVFWVAVLCSLVEVYLRFRGTCCLHHQGEVTSTHGATAQKTAIFIIHMFASCTFFLLLLSSDIS
jgi:hypothetical protein